MKLIEVKTSSEAYRLANKLTSEYAVKIVDNIYPSDKDFNGIILHVKGGK